VGGGDEVDVVTAGFLKLEHHIRKIFIPDCFAPSFMCDGPVLAEDAPKIAVGKKDGSRAVLPYQGQFFAEMRVRAEDDRLGRRTAETRLVVEAVHAALSGAKAAFSEDAIRFLDPLFQPAFSFKFGVARLPRLGTASAGAE
jgi:hypothetical protein